MGQETLPDRRRDSASRELHPTESTRAMRVPWGAGRQGREQRPAGQPLVQSCGSPPHRGRPAPRPVVIGRRVVEDLLDGPGGAGKEDDARVGTGQQPSSRVALTKYFAMWDGEGVRRFVAVTTWGCPTEAPPPGQPSRTAKAARAQSETDGRERGCLGQDFQRLVQHLVGTRGRYAPRFAASIAPGPPPVATVSPAGPARGRAGRRPRTLGAARHARGRPSRPPPGRRRGVRPGRPRRRRRGRSAAARRRCRRPPWSAGTRRTRGRPGWPRTRLGQPLEEFVRGVEAARYGSNGRSGTGGKTSAPSARTFAAASGSIGQPRNTARRCRWTAARTYGPSGRPTGPGSRRGRRRATTWSNSSSDSISLSGRAGGPCVSWRGGCVMPCAARFRNR